MNITPFVHEGLGNSSYLLELDDHRAVLFDPDRSVARYLQMAEARGLTVAAVFETHLHADFVSGARDVAAATGATLFVPRGAGSRLAHQPVDGASVVRLDGFEVSAIASAGHTPEHLSYAVRAGGAPPALFSGGSLIVGGAARTDLIAPEMTETRSRAQHRTLRTAFTVLPADVATASPTPR